MRRPQHGLTLVELMVALGLLALLSLMSGRGIDAMLRDQARLDERGLWLASLQTALAQWTLDLEHSVETPYLSAIAWDGAQLRLVRHSPVEDGLLVVAWGAARMEGQLRWRRWQSAPQRDRAGLLQAWEEAADALTPNAPAAVTLVPIEGWQVFYAQGARWQAAQASGGAPGRQTPVTQLQSPRGVRLQLQLPDQASLSGTLALDWARPGALEGRP